MYENNSQLDWLEVIDKFRLHFVLVVAANIATVYLLWMYIEVVPRLMSILESMNITPPLGTKAIVFFAETIETDWPFIVPLVLIATYRCSMELFQALRTYGTTDKGLKVRTYSLLFLSLYVPFLILISRLTYDYGALTYSRLICSVG